MLAALSQSQSIKSKLLFPNGNSPYILYYEKAGHERRLYDIVVNIPNGDEADWFFALDDFVNISLCINAKFYFNIISDICFMEIL